MKIFEIFKRKWIRIGDLGICCPICGKPDWCRVSRDGKYVLCSRVPVYSMKGNLHKVDKSIETQGIKDKDGYYPPINWYALNKSYVKNCPVWRVKQFGALKGISPRSLMRLSIGYDGDAYTFPICNEEFDIVGIQRQFSDGTKLMVGGSRLGLFIPTNFSTAVNKLFVTEGMSDTAAALDLDLNAVGRLNCSSGTKIIKILANKMASDVVVVIVSDNDIKRAGQDGAFKLAEELKVLGRQAKVLIPPFKDLRNWKRKMDLDSKRFNVICERLPWL